MQEVKNVDSNARISFSKSPKICGRFYYQNMFYCKLYWHYLHTFEKNLACDLMPCTFGFQSGNFDVGLHPQKLLWTWKYSWAICFLNLLLSSAAKDDATHNCQIKFWRFKKQLWFSNNQIFCSFCDMKFGHIIHIKLNKT